MERQYPRAPWPLALAVGLALAALIPVLAFSLGDAAAGPAPEMQHPMAPRTEDPEEQTRHFEAAEAARRAYDAERRDWAAGRYNAVAATGMLALAVAAGIAALFAGPLAAVAVPGLVAGGGFAIAFGTMQAWDAAHPLARVAVAALSAGLVLAAAAFALRRDSPPPSAEAPPRR